MRRISNLFDRIISIENLKLADKKARKGKLNQYGVKVHIKKAEENILDLNILLESGEYKTAKYQIFTIYDKKEREIYKLPFYPDRILHHAILNILEDIFVSVFTADSYSCIKKRGVHKASYKLRRYLKDVDNTQYYLQLDIRKFYPSVDHEILKSLLRRKFKDKKLLLLLDEIIDSAPGCPIGNYLSQYFANYYLTFFDHWLKEVLRVKYYLRYADDMIFLGSKEELKNAFNKINNYLKTNLKLDLKPNWKLSPIASYKGDTGSGIDFCGYVHYRECTLIRKRIKEDYKKAIKNGATKETLAGFNGWISHADCINLKNTYENTTN